eukprot:750394-Hanusia_phi.AAC.3
MLRSNQDQIGQQYHTFWSSKIDPGSNCGQIHRMFEEKSRDHGILAVKARSKQGQSKVKRGSRFLLGSTVFWGGTDPHPRV